MGFMRYRLCSKFVFQNTVPINASVATGVARLELILKLQLNYRHKVLHELYYALAHSKGPTTCKQLYSHVTLRLPLVA